MNCNIKLTFVINTQLHLYTGISARRTRALHAQMIHSRYVRIYEYDVGCYTFQLHVLYCKTSRWESSTALVCTWWQLYCVYEHAMYLNIGIVYVYVYACMYLSLTQHVMIYPWHTPARWRQVNLSTSRDRTTGWEHCMYVYENKNRGSSVVCTYNRENLWE